MLFRLSVAFCLVAAVAVLGSTLISVLFGGRHGEAEGMRTMRLASHYADSVLVAERDRNRSNVNELASRPSILEATVRRDVNELKRLLAITRPNFQDDLVAIYLPDFSLLAGDSTSDLELEETTPRIVKAALAGVPRAGLVAHDSHLMLSAAAPIVINGTIVGAVLASDLIDSRIVRRLSNITSLSVGLATERGKFVGSDATLAPTLSSEHWSSLHGRGEIWFHQESSTATLHALACSLFDTDDRVVGALIVSVPEASHFWLSATDMPLFFVLNTSLLASVAILGLLMARVITRNRDPLHPLASAPLDTLPSATPPAAPPQVAPAEGAYANRLAPEEHALEEVRSLSGLTIDRARHLVLAQGVPVALTPTEFDLLWSLAQVSGRVLTRDTLLERLRGEGWHAEPGLLDTHISNLRRKIEPNPARPRYVITIRGIGYKLNDSLPTDAFQASPALH